MTVEEMIAELEEIMDLEEGNLELDAVLEDIEEWDSLSKLSLLAFAKKSFDISLSSDEINAFVTVKDICDRLSR